MTNVPRVYWETVGAGSHFRKCILSGIEWLHLRSLELCLHSFTWQQAEKCSPSRILSNNMRWFFNKQYLKQMLYWNSWQEITVTSLWILQKHWISWRKSFTRSKIYDIREIYEWQLDPEYVHNKLVDFEDPSRRNNLTIDGIKEKDRESWKDCATEVEKLFREKLDIEDKIITERAHRAKS